MSYLVGDIEDVPEEAPVRLLYNGREVSILMCTPSDLQELAVGWLYGQGLINGTGEVAALEVCSDKRRILVRTTEDRWVEKAGWRQLLTSGCGGGSVLASQLYEVIPPVSGTVTIEPEQLRDLMKGMMADTIVYKHSGGVHTAAIADKDRLLFQSEDIGRHNAVDKAIGKGLLAGLDFSNTLLLTTGRVSSEMVLKAARARVPVVASVSIPTSLAIEIACRSGMSLIGRAIGHRATSYCREQPTGLIV